MVDSGLVLGRGDSSFQLKNVIIDDYRENKDFPGFDSISMDNTVVFPC